MKRVTVKGELDRLTDQEGALWGGFLRSHAILTRTLDTQLRAAHGLSLSSYEVLLKVAWAPDARIRMSDLAERCLLTPGGVTRIVHILVNDGLVARHVPPHNKRVVLVEITDKGFALLQAAQRTHLAGVRTHFLRHFDDTEAPLMARVWGAIQLEGD
jgi:DNA-binding MarR family transcriptional regulator